MHSIVKLFSEMMLLATVLQVVSSGTAPDFRDGARWTPLLEKGKVNVMEDDQGNSMPWSISLFYRSNIDRKIEGMELVLLWRGEEIPVYRVWQKDGVPYHALVKNASDRNSWTDPVRGPVIEFVGRIGGGRIRNIVFMIYDGDATHPCAHLAFSDPEPGEEIPVFSPASRGATEL